MHGRDASLDSLMACLAGTCRAALRRPGCAIPPTSPSPSGSRRSARAKTRAGSRRRCNPAGRHLIADPKDGELAWVSWVPLKRQDYDVRFINPSKLHGYPSESYNINTRLLETAANPVLRGIVGEAAYDAASFLVPQDPDSKNRWVSQGVRTMFTLYNKASALYPSERWSCSPGGLWDFWGRPRSEIAEDLMLWAADRRMEDEAGMCRLIAGLTDSPDQWNAYASLIIERLQGFQPGMAARELTSRNSFDPADMKRHRTALFIIGSARSETSRTFVGAMTAAVIERFADAQGPLRALVVGEEWGQLYLSNFYEVLTLYRQGGHQSPRCVSERRCADRDALWARNGSHLEKAVAHTLYRGLPGSETLKEIEHRSGRTSVMVRGLMCTRTRSTGRATTWLSRCGRCSRSRISGARRKARQPCSMRAIGDFSQSRYQRFGSGQK